MEELEPGAAVGAAPAVTGNLLTDFPADEFAIRVFCERCGYQAELAREASIRILYKGVGGVRRQRMWA